VIGEAPRDRAADPAKRPEAAVDNQFAALRAYVNAPGGKAPIESLGEAVAEFYAQLVAYQSSRSQGGTTMSITPAAARLRAEAGRAPPPISTVLVELAGRAEGNVTQEVRKEIAGGAAGAAPTCRIAIPNRYPFSRASAQDVPLNDFARVFGPAGELATFFAAKLQAEVDMSGPVWRPRQGSPVPPEVITPFQRAAAIRDAFFAAGAQPGFAVDLLLISADPSVAEIVLESEGQVLRFSAGKKDVLRVQWPGPKPGSGARLALAPSVGGAPAGGLSADGNWALFRLIDRARVEQAGGPDRLRLTFTLDARPVVLELRAGSVRNPFALGDLQAFRCPG
jgi:type VI secretion system protein ImpL